MLPHSSHIYPEESVMLNSHFLDHLRSMELKSAFTSACFILIFVIPYSCAISRPGELEGKNAKSLLRVKRGFFKWLTGEENDEEREAANRERNRERTERTRENNAWLDRVCPTKCWNPWPATWGACSQPCGGGGVQWQTRTPSFNPQNYTRRPTRRGGLTRFNTQNYTRRPTRRGRLKRSNTRNYTRSATRRVIPRGFNTQNYTRRSTRRGGPTGECGPWVSRNGCPGPSRRSQACNRFCENGGRPHATGCTCPAGWKDRCCDKRLTCPSPGTLTNGAVSPSGNSQHYGTTVRFSCQTGYRLVGSATRVCTGSGTWTNSVPTCNIVSCGNPGTPANSKLEFVSGSSYTFGSSVKVTCSHGYRLLGDSIRQCAATGSWSGTAPSCQLIACPPQSPPANGVVAYPTGRNLDDNLVYSCNTGFVLQGASTRQCQSNGRWTSVAGTCSQILCDNLPAPANGRVTHSGSMGGKTKFGQKATFSCNQGYVLQGLATLTCAGRTIVGQFNGRPPTCAPVNCVNPGDPANGVRSGSAFTLNQRVTFTCSPGHFLRGQESITCLHTGQWSSPKPQCLACAANTYKPGTNNAKTCTTCPPNSNTKGVTRATSQTQCLCVRGYTGNPGGPCTLIQCPALPIPANGRKVSCGNKLDQNCVFACNSGHVIARGDVVRTCTELRTWTGSDVQCNACPKDTYRGTTSQCEPCPTNSRTTGTGNEKSGCVCRTGYQGPGGGPCNDINECSTSNGGCEQTCVNRPGDYTCECTNVGSIKDLDDFKKCVPKNQCPEMPKPANGGIICYSQRKTNTERCQVTCNLGFEHLEDPNAFEQCGPSTNWKWSHEISNRPILDCIPAFFLDIQVEAEVNYFTTDCNALTVDEKRRIGQDFIDFLATRGVCALSNGGSCKITDVSVECGGSGASPSGRKKRNANQEVIIRFKLRSAGRALPRDRECDVACRREFAETTESVLITQAQKVANNYRGRSSVITKESQLLESRVLERRVSFGGVEMRPSSWVTLGRVETSCGEGKTHRNGTCVPFSCGLPRPPANSHMTVNGHFFGNVTHFSCSPGYALEGKNSTVCLANGKWSSYQTSCVHVQNRRSPRM